MNNSVLRSNMRGPNLRIEILEQRYLLAVAPFDAEIALRDAGQVSHIALLDVDRDNDDDLVLSLFSNELVWHENRGGEFAVDAQPFASAEGTIRSLQPFRWEEDEAEQLLVVVRVERLFQVYLYEETDSIWNAEHITQASAVTPGDVDGDGDIDLVLGSSRLPEGDTQSNSGSAWSWLENDGTKQFERRFPARFLGLGETEHIALRDLDGDGDQDVIAGFPLSAAVLWYENLGSGEFRDFEEVSMGRFFTGVSGLELADVDHDGDLDILTVTEGDFIITSWIENIGEGEFETHFYGGWQGGGGLAMADLDNDGDEELLVMSNRDGLRYLEGLRDGLRLELGNPINEFRYDWWLQRDDVFFYVAPFAVQDLDQDNDLDVLFYNPNTREISLMRNRLEALALGDVNRDLVIDSADIDALQVALETSLLEARFDVDGTGSVDEADTEHLVKQVLQTTAGDLNTDGAVDEQDFDVLAANYGSHGRWSAGDFNSDGVVDFADFLLLREHFNAG